MQPNCRQFVNIVSTLLFVLICGSAARAAEQDLHDLMVQALDDIKPVEIADLPVRDALAQLETKTGVRTVIADDVLALLPYGDQTQISLRIAGIPLRRGMERAFESLGLALRLDGDKVMLDPSPMLARLGRQLTIDEAVLLERLASAPLEALKPEPPALQFRVDPASKPRESFERAIAAAPAPSALRQLDAATAALSWVWVVDGATVVFWERREFVKQALARPIDVRYQHTPLDGLLVELGRRVGLRVSFEPGCLKRIEAREQIVDLEQRGTTVGQILERIAGNTGLRYEATPDGVRISGPVDPSRPSSGSGMGRIVAHLIVQVADGTTLLLPVREGELNEGELKRIDQARVDGIRAVREYLAKDKPAE